MNGDYSKNGIAKTVIKYACSRHLTLIIKITLFDIPEHVEASKSESIGDAKVT
ncbi:hypothetical protein GCM10026987_19870 [Belliella aquatica]|uniref:Uncharacterized protein n=1 Tax=Belliella aquatica TaxID=1323734 RepID=A0ABQ1N2C3_9BACT|nr:hypothetical protein GCM10010993_33240 [Belliella aquatica]